jgi:3-oxoacyl-ACP reductase-like protein
VELAGTEIPRWAGNFSQQGVVSARYGNVYQPHVEDIRTRNRSTFRRRTPASAAVAPAGTAVASVAPSTTATPAASVASAPAKIVDVTAILDDLAAKNPEKLDWRKSIVDLMKLVGIDSSLSARKQLATELQYSGDENDSATMNVWLHKQVIIKLAENGSKVPQELLS